MTAGTLHRCGAHSQTLRGKTWTLVDSTCVTPDEWQTGMLVVELGAAAAAVAGVAAAAVEVVGAMALRGS